jgi:hypothetical protein
VKAKLEFELPGDQYQFDNALRGSDLKALVQDIDDQCRAIIKYELDPSDDLTEFCTKVRMLIASANVLD